MEAWRQDEWLHCGIVLSVALEGVTLERNAAALFGIEANCSDNAYLTEVAQELLPEALDAGRAAARRLCAALETSGSRPQPRSSEFRSGCSASSELLAKGIRVKPLTGGVP